MKGYYRVMLGRKSVHAQEAFDGSFVGTDFGIGENLSDRLPEQWQQFNREFIPVYLSGHPDKSKIAAGLACGAIWTVSKGIKVGDAVLSPDGSGRYRVALVAGDYYYQPDGVLPHRRPVTWLEAYIDRADMSDSLKHSAGSIGTVSNVTAHQAEIERLLEGVPAAPPPLVDGVVEDQTAFALEKHLEDFLVENWSQTELGRDFVIYQDDGERLGQQYPTDTGPIDILAISKDKQKLLVVELKKGRASDAVVGQVLRYMGYVRELIAEPTQVVQGAIIASDDDNRIRRALSMTTGVSFYRFAVSFTLVKG